MMIPQTGPETPPVPSARALAKTTALALVVAIVILVTIILPAEYGRDPLGTGRILGLTRLSAPLRTPEPVAPPTGGTKMAPVQQGPAAIYPAAFKADSTQFVLEPYQFVEYKYHLEKGAEMVYSWKGTSTVIHDFHGEEDGTPESPVSYEKTDTNQESGAITAPFSGIHGWYLENPGGEPITITIASAGFYTSALEFRSDRTRHPHELSDAAGVPAAPAK
jgi:hypothetical protein